MLIGSCKGLVKILSVIPVTQSMCAHFSQNWVSLVNLSH